MDHPLRALETSIGDARPWRTAAIVATGLAAVELVLLIVAGGALLGHRPAGTRSATPTARAAAAHAGPTRAARAERTRVRHRVAALRPRSAVRVIVLNGNGRRGAAGAAASRVRGHGYRLGSVGNASRMDYARSMVMYRPGYEAEGRRLAHDLGIALVGPLDGIRPAALGRAQAVLIVGG